MADIRPRIDFDGRTRLETVIPLSTPYLVFLDPSDICNAKCPWCPTGFGEALKYKKPQLMDFLLYKKIVNDLAEMPEPIKTLRLYKDGEPLLNPELHKMVRYAKESGRFGSIDTTTNGSLLTYKRGKQLVDAGLDKIFISVPNDYTEEYRDTIQAFIKNKGRCQAYVKIIGDDMLELEKELFFQEFADADRVFIEHKAPCWPGFDVGKVDSQVGIYGQPVREVQVCPYIFYSLAINSDGTVSLCFLDWKHGMIVGDLKLEKFKDIWDENITLYQKIHLRRARGQIWLCRNCGQLSHGAPDDIDQYAEELLEKL